MKCEFKDSQVFSTMFQTEVKKMEQRKITKQMIAEFEDELRNDEGIEEIA